jgi:beta-barrel assembly-enhancing protease
MKLSQLTRLRRQFTRQTIRTTIAFVSAIAVMATAPLASQAIPWFDLLRQGIQIIQISNINDSQEMQLGAAMNQQIISGMRISQNRALTEYVNGIGQKLARNSARPNIRYTFQVVEDNNINAFATMGGFVYVNRGTISAADNEAQLAGVIGHEIGHITGKHALNNLKQAAIAQGISTLVGVDRDRLVQIGLELAINRPRSRRDEYDADSRGLNNLIQAGYAPSGMPEFMKKLMKANSMPEIFSTHPAPAERVARLTQITPPAYRNRTEGLNPTFYKQRLQNLTSSETIQ